MATILPFRAIRPVRDKAHLVASRSVDAYTAEELRDKLRGNPYTFLHVINPDFDDGAHTKAGSPERLQKVKSAFQRWCASGILARDEKSAYYVYRQVKDGHEYTGIIACTSIDDYLNGVIRVHEQTITQREEKLKEYLDVCEFNAEPVLFCYPNDALIDRIIADTVLTPPENDFSTTDKVRHTLWLVSDPHQLREIAEHFSRMPAIYIADGHHRSASSALLGQSRRQTGPYKGDEPFNFFLGVFFAESQLRIFDYNRLVKDMGGLSVPDLLKRLEEKFVVTGQHGDFYIPTQKHQLSLYASGTWYSLDARPGTYNSDDPVGSLDASILTDHILSPLFGIHDLRIDKRVGFVPGIAGAGALKRAVDEGRAEVAFGLYPVTMSHLKWIADTGNIMPPKSTWVEPKMRSGLVIYSFEK